MEQHRRTKRPRPTRARRTIHAAVALTVGLGIAVTAAPASSAGATPTAGSATEKAQLPIYLDTHYSPEARAADLVSRMTLPEKVAQLSTNSGPAIPRLGVQQYTYWSEGQHGVNTLGANQNNGGNGGAVRSTSFPTNFASTMSWDPSLIYQETTAISDEARGFLDKSLFGVNQNNLGPSASDYGSLTFWAPTVNMDRDPRWGRTDEAFGEDPYLVSQMAGAFVNGYEGNTPSGHSKTGYLKVAATAKHYALNDVEQDRTGVSSNVSDTDLHDYYTKQFASLIENAHVSGLMTSYNAINGTPSVADTYTANQLAQRQYGFNGYVTSDCGAIGTTYQTFPGGHDWAPPGWTTDGKSSTGTWTNTATGTTVPAQAGGQAYALRAGTDLNCAGGENTYADMTAAINAGILSEGVIDNALVKIFTVRMETGEFDPAGSNPYTAITKAQIQSPAHQALAVKIADNSLVLLKNRPAAGATKPLLPLSAAATNKIVIVGDMANTVTLGNYSSDPSLKVSAVQGITAEVQKANPGATVTFDACGTSTTATGAAICSAQTLADVASADAVVVFVALTLPAGWTAANSTPNTFATVAAGATVSTTWSVAVPASQQPGPHVIGVTETVGGAQAGISGTQTAVAYSSLTAGFNNVSITDDANHGPGDIDGGGNSFSAQALAAAGLNPGAQFAFDGLVFAWPSAAAGTADNVEADGRAFAITGSGSTLGFLGAAANGQSSGTATITYTDGTTQQFTLGFGDWASTSPFPGSQVAVTSAYGNTSTGTSPWKASVFYDSVALQAGKTVQSVTLPAGTSSPLHVFAATIG